MLIVRRILFYLFLLIYLILCPGLLLYASGYIFDPFTREVERTGLIHLSSIPPGAVIYLEHRRFVRKTPATIDQLRPGDYRVTLSMPGHRPWTQSVAVRAGKASVFEKALLLPNDLLPQAPLKGAFRQLFPMPGTDFLLLSRGNDLGGIEVYNLKNDKSMPLLEPGSPWFDFPVLSLSHQENSRSFIIYGGGLLERKYLWVMLKGGRPVFADITRFFLKDPLLIEWDPSNTNELFAVYTNYIDRVDIEAGVIYPRDINGVKGVGFHNNRVYLMTADNRFIKYGRDKTKTESFLEGHHFDKALLDKNTFYHISAPAEEKLIFLLGEDGSLLFNDFPYQIVDKGVKGMAFHARAKMFMYWNSSAVMLVDPGPADASAVKSPATKVVFSGGQDIKQCFWGDAATHIICNDNDRVYFIEVEPEGGDHNEFITAIRKGSSIAYNPDTGWLYYINEQGLFEKVQLVPDESVVDQFLNKRT